MNLVHDSILHVYVVVDQWPVLPFLWNFNAFLKKAKLKDDGSNNTDWVRNLRIILIAAQKNYVLEAPLGARPAADAADDVKNVWQSKADDYSIVQCAMLYGLESGLQRHFGRHGA